MLIIKKLKLIAAIVPVIAIAIIWISISAGCGKSDTSNSTNSPDTAATPSTSKPDLLTTCPVTGDALGSMGTPYVIVYQGQEVKFCCASCTNDFFKEPDKYLKLIRAADKPATQ